MLKSKLALASTSAAALIALAHCGGSSPGNPSGTGGSSSTGGATTSTGGATTNTGGATTNTGGSSSTGGATTNTGGATTSTGGTVGGGGRAGGSGPGTGGTVGGGGAGPGTGGATGVDMGGVPLAKVGDSTDVTKKYLNLGDMRVINNRWGSDELNCTGTKQKVLINSDMTFGWEFNRPACAGGEQHGKPDYPEVEFGVAPFGMMSPLLTSPAFSSTTLLPIQLKDLKSATLDIVEYNTTLTQGTFWDSNYEFWISRKDPRTNADAGVFAEVIVFLGWNNGRNDSGGEGWPCVNGGGTVTNGGKTYQLCHQDDAWAGGKWRFYNFIVQGGSMPNFTGKADIKGLLDWVRSKYSGFTDDMWLTRIEVGVEVDNKTAGKTSIKNLTFEVNGEKRTPQFGK